MAEPPGGLGRPVGYLADTRVRCLSDPSIRSPSDRLKWMEGYPFRMLPFRAVPPDEFPDDHRGEDRKPVAPRATKPRAAQSGGCRGVDDGDAGGGRRRRCR